MRRSCYPVVGAAVNDNVFNLFVVAKVQRVFQIGALKRIIQEKNPGVTVNAKLLKERYDSHLEIKSGESAGTHFLTTALALWNAMFSVPKLKAGLIIIHCFQRFELIMI